MLNYVEILGVKVNKVDMGQAIQYIKDSIENNDKRFVVTPNSEMIVMAQEDKDFAQILNQADLCIPDGAGVVLASKLYNDPLSERVAGFDLMQETLKMANEQGYSIYLLGGKQAIIELACQKILQRYPKLKISGIHHGFLDKDLEQRVLEDINKFKPDILYVGMGVPLQEKFMKKYFVTMEVGVVMAVGGSFDVLAEQVKRAPRWMQRLNLEWLFRLMQEPGRFFRMMALPRFVWLVSLDYIKRKFR